MTSSIPVVLERDNVNDESVTLVRWYARHGDPIEANSLLAEVETSKANLEVYAPATGFLLWVFPEGADVKVTTPIGYIVAQAPAETPEFEMTPATASNVGTSEKPASPGAKPAETPIQGNVQTTLNPEFTAVTEFRQRFSPVAAKLMEEHGLAATDFADKSAVRKQDILDLLHRTPALPDAPISSNAGITKRRIPLTQITQPYQEVKLSKMKRREGCALAAGDRNAVSSAVSVTCFTRGLRRVVESRMAGGNASAVIVYEVSRLLRRYPALNATYSNGAMLCYDQVNLGYAIDDGRGLKVVTFQNCDTLSLQQVTAQLRDLTVAYLDNKLTPALIANATFTISDLSGMGVSNFLPLISENQGGILGVGGEQFPPKSTYGFYTLTLTFDHQLSDGRYATLFLNDLKDRLLSYECTIQETQQEITCSQCGRTAAELKALDYHLLKSACPDGYLCTYCLAGY